MGDVGDIIGDIIVGFCGSTGTGEVIGSSRGLGGIGGGHDLMVERCDAAGNVEE